MKDSGGATPYIDDRLKREQWLRGITLYNSSSPSLFADPVVWSIIEMRKSEHSSRFMAQAMKSGVRRLQSSACTSASY